MSGRPFLTAEWLDLVMLNFEVPAGLIARLAPAGTVPDLHAGRAYISMVAFRFAKVRVLGVPVPGHTAFDEINLRYYVKSIASGEVRRGVVFFREIVPRFAIAFIANKLYNENYVRRPMRSSLARSGAAFSAGDVIEYAWRSKCALPQPNRPRHTWNRIGARAASEPVIPQAGSIEEFIVEHYWGYVRGRDGTTTEYQVAHPTWRVARADAVVWDCDVDGTYAGPFADHLRTQPTSAIIAEGSPIQVYRGRRIGKEAN